MAWFVDIFRTGVLRNMGRGWFIIAPSAFRSQRNGKFIRIDSAIVYWGKLRLKRLLGPNYSSDAIEMFIKATPEFLAKEKLSGSLLAVFSSPGNPARG